MRIPQLAKRGESGRDWYATAYIALRTEASALEISVDRFAGIVAVLSPRLPWDRNIAYATHLVRSGWCPALGRSVGKALRIRAGEPSLSVLSGPKVRAFYRALLGDPDACVLDSWMLRALGAKSDKPTALQYAKHEARFRKFAARAGVPVASYQAMVWTGIRNLNGAK